MKGVCNWISRATLLAVIFDGTARIGTNVWWKWKLFSFCLLLFLLLVNFCTQTTFLLDLGAPGNTQAPSASLLRDLDHHTLGSDGSLLSSVFFLAHPVPGHRCGVEVVRLGATLGWCLGLLSRPAGSAHFTYKLLSQIAVDDFVVLFCACSIYCMSVCPGRGIPPLWLFFPTIKSVFFLNMAGFPHCSNATLSFGYINIIDLIWFEVHLSVINDR